MTAGARSASPSAAPGGVARRVAAAGRSRALARAAESVLLGAAAALVTLAAAVASGAAPAALGSWAAALAAGSLCAATWVVEQRTAPAALARLVDRRLGLGGALCTAFEAAHRPTPVSALLERAVCQRVRVAAAARAALPASLPLVALPFLAAALLALVLDARRAAPPPAWRAALTGGAAQAVAQLREGALEAAARGELPPDALERVLDLDRRARGLAGDAAALEPEALAAELAALSAGLDELGERLPPTREAAQALERAEGFVDAAERRLGERAARPGGSEPAGGGAPPGTPGSDLAPGAADGTMSVRRSAGTDPGAEAAPGATPGPAPGSDPGGVLGPRAWSERDAALVERWVERRRAAAGPRTPETSDPE